MEVQGYLRSCTYGQVFRRLISYPGILFFLFFLGGGRGAKGVRYDVMVGKRKRDGKVNDLNCEGEKGKKGKGGGVEGFKGRFQKG